MRPDSVERSCSFRLLARGNQLIGVGNWDAQLSNLVFQLGDQRIKQRDFAGILPLLVLAKTIEVGFVLRTPAVEIEAVLFDDGLSKPFHLVNIWSPHDPHTSRPF